MGGGGGLLCLIHLAWVALSLGFRDGDDFMAVLAARGNQCSRETTVETQVVTLKDCEDGAGNALEHFNTQFAVDVTNSWAGANGIVYKAKQGEGAQDIAMKFSKHDGAQRMKNEAAIMARVNKASYALHMLAACNVEGEGLGSYVVLMPWLPVATVCSTATSLKNQNVTVVNGKLISTWTSGAGPPRKDASFIGRVRAFVDFNTKFFCDMSIVAGLVDTDRRFPAHNVLCTLDESNGHIKPLHFDFDAAEDISKVVDGKILHMWQHVALGVAMKADETMKEQCGKLQKPLWNRTDSIAPLLDILQVHCGEGKAFTYFQDYAKKKVCADLDEREQHADAERINKVKTEVGCRA